MGPGSDSGRVFVVRVLSPCRSQAGRRLRPSPGAASPAASPVPLLLPCFPLCMRACVLACVRACVLACSWTRGALVLRA
jgi:hypothetical protein